MTDGKEICIQIIGVDDEKLKAIKFILTKFVDELFGAEEKFPLWPDDPIYAAVNVGEEAGELLKACNEYVNEPGKYPDQSDRIEREAIHTGAMALRFLLNFTKEVKL
jgi:hypothetical protein